ncbi:MAG: transglutaminase family protein [Anaerovoracaceae bacterium]
MKRTMKGHGKIWAAAAAILVLLVICAVKSDLLAVRTENSNPQAEIVFEENEMVPLAGAPDTSTEAKALSSSPAAVTAAGTVEASGIHTAEAGGAVIDYSNVADGYVMVKYKESTEKKLKVQVKGPETVYTYNLKPKKWETFPLSDGNGTYQILVLKNIADSRYSIQATVSCDVKLKDAFGPYIRSNQYVNFADAPKATAKAASLTKKKKDALSKVEAVYNYVVNNITYDKKKAETVKSGYLPDLDSVLKKKKGICFDYASLMTGMLRSQGVPCKLVVGYAGTTYHAWISVWVEGKGWIDDVIYFNGTKWKRMDPTFASTSNKSKSVMKYIGNGKNYTAKYFY